MTCYLGVSVRFLDASFHGRRDGGKREWPPSPLRVFQALVSAAATRSLSFSPLGEVLRALRWLERQSPPIVVAPRFHEGVAVRIAVPNNDLDSIWGKPGDATKESAELKTLKTVQPTYMLGGDTIHFLWPLRDRIPEEARGHIGVLAGIARSVVALGWGLDMAVGRAAIVSDAEADALAGERWAPDLGQADNGLRVPIKGTLDDLTRRHEGFLDRLRGDVYTPPPPLTAFETVSYRRSTDSPRRSVAAFSLLRTDARAFRVFDTARRGLTVAGMLRHTTKLAAGQSGWTDREIDGFVLGHGERRGDAQHAPVGPRRFAYLPLPSIEGRGEGKARVVGSIRRAILMTFAESDDKIVWARRALSGMELISERTNEPVGFLKALSTDESVIQYYTRAAASWSTVTPVVLPGFDDPAHYRRRLERGTSAGEQRMLLERLAERIDALLRKAIVQAGFSQVLAKHVEFEWRKAGFWPGADLADRYGIPNHLKRFPRYHVTLHWRDPEGGPVEVPGPICLGSGRFCGVGLFAAV